jgi:thiosulfate/3-mercaptopyruvate sulfurtransferase
MLVSREDPRLKPMHQLHHALWEPAGADASHVRTVVTYCRTGNQAALAYFVARYVGYRDVRLYDGSFIEWAGRPADQYPVSRAAAGGAPEHRH